MADIGYKIMKKKISNLLLNNNIALKLRVRKINIDKILMGGEGGIGGNHYSVITENITRSSTRITESPHYLFLKEYNEIGESIFNFGVFEKTAYYKNASECIDYNVNYFEITKKDLIIENAKFFINNLYLKAESFEGIKNGHYKKGSPIQLRPIKNSNYYELIDGNHRIACAMIQGEQTVNAIIKRKSTSTAAQDLITSVAWQKNKKELYQPVNLPEVEDWPVIRVCNDRFTLMKGFLEKHMLLGKLSNYLDIGCSYGWFVDKFQTELKIESHGIDIDPFALKVGYDIYKIPPGRLRRFNISEYLKETNEKYDVTSLFSVIHQITPAIPQRK